MHTLQGNIAESSGGLAAVRRGSGAEAAADAAAAVATYDPTAERGKMIYISIDI